MVILSLLLPSVAHAGDLQLIWSAPRPCPNGEQVLANIDALLGRSAEVALSRPLYVTATVQHKGEDSWALEIAWHGDGGASSRTIEADSCVDLARAAALATALVIDPNANLTPASLSSRPAPESPEEVVLPPQQTREPIPLPKPGLPLPIAEPPDAAWPSLRASDLFATAVAAVGVLPGGAFGVGLGAEHYWRSFLMRGSFGTYLPRDWSKAGYRGSLWVGELNLEACYAVGTRRVHVSPCAGVGLQGYRAQTSLLDSNERRTRWTSVFRGGLGLEARYWLSPAWALTASGWMLVAPARPDFRLHPGTPVFAPDAASYRWALGVAGDVF